MTFESVKAPDRANAATQQSVEKETNTKRLIMALVRG
jgi:hypothetical protein